ncbi:MAG: mannose-1-phosphate guanylyltransferase/mannose-6-phosphate isomerase [Desulfovibrio sp.]|nr:mannose-1-phosphate guanylyltransferase/mannose-6-phosphate isomerase [Desulfovibrio sp.]
MAHIIPVILCGGSGTRLWPLSRESYPKQFVDMGNGRTLFGTTLDRVLALPDVQEPIVICNEAHRFFAAAELYKRGTKSRIILEPEGRNTAPALAIAAEAVSEENPDTLMLALPSDHAMDDMEAFVSGVMQAKGAAQEGRIVTFGIVPTEPATGFGYIQQGDVLGNGTYRVARFVEKPALQSAKDMLAQGGFFWNSGLFLMPARTYLEELRAYAYDIYDACSRAWKNRSVDGAFIRPEKEAFLSSPEDSIDYAVMEHTQTAAVMPLAVKWSDLGSWEACYQVGIHDANGNVCLGDVLTENVENCYCNARHRLVAAIDLKDMLIVETRDAVLVAPRKRAQEVKSIVNALRRHGRPEYRQHPLVYRPWGSYETLALEERFQVKRIIVNPGAELSLQMHHHRAEHWVVVSGTAQVTNGEETRLLTENQSTYIPVGTKHRLKNPGVIPLVLIEIQSGAYLGEDDIVRFADVYGREKMS